MRSRWPAPLLVAGLLLVMPLSTAAAANPPSGAARPLPRGVCGASLASELASTGDARQLVVVTAPLADTTVATLTLFQRRAGCFVRVGGPFVARIGADGFSDHHREGDGTTPTGAYGIGAVMYGNAPNPGVRYPYHRLVCGDWWDEDPSSPAYNAF